ncbi:hypothetical protein [Labedaea rhizosphaerae]|uniref:hypothetical protein n=1 Tax=Labedaea rhizosphaerae TaxID=598644 RepID=UPI00105D79AD|nr:hypothetical protein [Labedaea rhizosphaerae]
MSAFVFNPAADPTRKWVRNLHKAPSADPVVIDAEILIRSLPKPGEATVKVLARHDKPCNEQDLADELGGTTAHEVQHALFRANQFAEAFGYVPLIQRDKDGYHLNPEARLVVAATEEV